MLISEVELTNFRNIGRLKISLSSGLNFFYGENGSGKTSILEGLNVYWNGRSFRTNSLTEIINTGGSHFVVAGKVEEGVSQKHFGLHYENATRKRTVKFDDDNINKSSSLAMLMPTLYFSPSNNYYHSASPKERRETIFWFMFHVEHEFRVLFKNLKQALDSRNAILREIKASPNYKSLISSIERNELCPHFENQLGYWENVLEELNSKLLSLLKVTIHSINDELISVQSLVNSDETEEQIKIRCNIVNQNFDRELFKERRKNDAKLGYTNYGFQKLDISFYKDNRKLVGLSRGEEKTLSVIFLLAIIKLVRNKTSNVLFLLDDIGAELDHENISTILRILDDLTIQSMITCVEKTTIESLLKNTENYKLFHVKQGSITED